MAAVAVPHREARWSRPALVPVPAARSAVVRRPVSARVQRRRRHLLWVVALLIALGVVWTLEGGVGWLGSGPLTAPGPDPSAAVPAAAVIHIVQPGDTVWSIARQFQPRGEIRPLVDRLMAETHGRPLQIGDRVALP